MTVEHTSAEFQQSFEGGRNLGERSGPLLGHVHPRGIGAKLRAGLPDRVGELLRPEIGDLLATAGQLADYREGRIDVPMSGKAEIGDSSHEGAGKLPESIEQGTGDVGAGAEEPLGELGLYGSLVAGGLLCRG